MALEWRLTDFVMPVDGMLDRFVLSLSTSPKIVFFELYTSPYTVSSILQPKGTLIASGQFTEAGSGVMIVDQNINVQVSAGTRISLFIRITEQLPTLFEGEISGGLFVIPD